MSEKYQKEFKEIFDYLSAPESNNEDSGAIVFGRKDPLVARKIVDLSQEGRVKWAVITGGIGKDSGDLQIPEAEYLAREAESYARLTGTELPPLILETQAKNGGENARNSLDVIRRAKLGHGAILAVAHATSLRRLAHMLDHAAVQRGEEIPAVYRSPSEYQFDASSPVDQEEALAEMNRLITWPSKDWLLPGVPDALPSDLVEFTLERLKDKE